MAVNVLAQEFSALSPTEQKTPQLPSLEAYERVRRAETAAAKTKKDLLKQKQGHHHEMLAEVERREAVEEKLATAQRQVSRYEKQQQALLAKIEQQNQQHEVDRKVVEELKKELALASERLDEANQRTAELEVQIQNLSQTLQNVQEQNRQILQRVTEPPSIGSQLLKGFLWVLEGTGELWEGSS